MIRCVAYYGDVREDLPHREVERIARRTQARNAGLGITGCLFHFGGHFVQVLEGDPDAVGRLYGTMVSGDRQPDVVGLSDHIVQARAFPNWSIRFVLGAGPWRGEGRDGRTPLSLGLLPEPGTAGAASSLPLLAEKLGRSLSTHLRIVPRQPRAMKTVDRLLDAAARMLARERGVDRLTLERAAAEAGVTQQSAYRYFAGMDDLIRMAVRRMQAAWHARFVDYMIRQSFETRGEIADAAVAFVVETYEAQFRASPRLKRDILLLYHDIEYEAAWLVSDAICESIAARAQRVRIGIAEMASGLTALWAVAKLMALRDAAQLRRLPVGHMMTAIFLAALEGPARPDGSGLARLT